MPELERQFWEFAKYVRIPTKDEGVISLAQPWGTQKFLVRELFQGIADDRRDCYVLKARQQGISSIMLALDAFWLQKFEGMQGALIAEDDENRAYFRSQFTEVVRSLPAKYSRRVLMNNRVQCVWGTKSRLLYLMAGKAKKQLGQSKGLTYVHGTEVASWGSVDGIAKLRGTLSDKHPHRLYVWESTAQGYNHFYDMWQDAQRAVTKRAIFIAWWRHEQYQVHRHSKVFRVYWDGRLTEEEAAWDREIKRRYRVEVSTAQWAWYRWKHAEGMVGDEATRTLMMHQEYPTLPEHAFQASGVGFLGAVVGARLQRQLGAVPPAEYYRYVFGPVIEKTELYPTDDAMAHLTVWEQPVVGAHYSIGADPAFGASQDSDRYVISVWRCERTRAVQVAELCTTELTTTQFAWACCHLCGAYMGPLGVAFILELTGPGMAVWQEIQRLQQWGWGTGRQAALQQVLGNVQHYIFRRPDSLGGVGAWQWKTTEDSKIWVLSRLRDQLVGDRLVLRSADLVEECGNLRQVSGGRFETSGRAYDDRVLAAALAVEAWIEQMSPMLTMMPLQPGETPAGPPVPAHQRAVQNLFAEINRE